MFNLFKTKEQKEKERQERDKSFKKAFGQTEEQPNFKNITRITNNHRFEIPRTDWYSFLMDYYD
jgi:hypothetical protein